MLSPMMMSQDNNIVSATNSMIEIHVSENAIRIIPRGYLKILQ